MAAASFMFYVFSAIAIACAAMVVTSRNPVHSVLFLILAFFNAAGLFVLLGAEFLAMILVVVYVGAVAVLFLFVVMMLDVNFADLRKGASRYVWIGAAVGVVLAAEITLLVGSWVASDAAMGLTSAAVPTAVDAHNTKAIGNLLYTDYVLLFQGAGMVLLVAMVGAIVLTLRQRDGVKKQRIDRQVEVTAKDDVEIVKVESGRGI